MKNLVNQNVKVWNYQQDWIESIKKKNGNLFCYKDLEFYITTFVCFLVSNKKSIKGSCIRELPGKF